MCPTPPSRRCAVLGRERSPPTCDGRLAGQGRGHERGGDLDPASIRRCDRDGRPQALVRRAGGGRAAATTAAAHPVHPGPSRRAGRRDRRDRSGTRSQGREPVRHALLARERPLGLQHRRFAVRRLLGCDGFVLCAGRAAHHLRHRCERAGSSELPTDERISRVQGQLEQVYPGGTAHLSGKAATMAWPQEMFTGGAYVLIGPETRALLDRPPGGHRPDSFRRRAHRSTRWLHGERCSERPARLAWAVGPAR